ncbi:MAG: hypothetical protein IT580_00900, partial [Verrucomicrobiales bacterium]|nr:hypothetical protein [Verrucomicrobiales bacterium]
MNPEAVGLLVSDINLGLVLNADRTFAISGGGTLGFLGLGDLSIGQAGIDIGATFAIRYNTSDSAVSALIPVPDPAGAGLAPILFNEAPTPTGPEIGGGLTLSVAGVFELSGVVFFKQLPGGGALLSAGSSAKPISLKIHAGSAGDFEVAGTARFKMGGAEGFRLLDLQMTRVVVFGQALPLARTGFPLTADLVNPVIGGGPIDAQKLLATRSFDITFNDVNSVGLNHATIDVSDLKVFINGIESTSVLGTTTLTRLGTSNTYRYTFSATSIPDGEYGIAFVNNGWRDLAGNTNGITGGAGFAATYSDVKTFVVVTPQVDGTLKAPPTASLVSPVTGQILDPLLLNARAFIDVAFMGQGGDPLDLTTINGDELLLEGSAKLDAAFRPGAPVKVGKGIYRYFLVDSNVTAGNTIPMFGPGELRVVYRANSFKAGPPTALVGNVQKIETVQLVAAPPGAAATGTLALGPLVLEAPVFAVQDFGFSDGKIQVTVTITVPSATLAFGGTGATTPTSTGGGSPTTTPTSTTQRTSGVEVKLTGIFVSFELAVGLPGNFSVSSTGKFALNISKLEAKVPGVVLVEADRVAAQYDPNGAPDQELVRIDRALITFPSFDLRGEISPFDPDPASLTNPLIPGLVVRQNGFTLGQAQLIYGGATPNLTPVAGADPSKVDPSTGKIKIGSILEFDDLRIGVTNFSVNFAAEDPVQFSGSIFFASGGARFLPGRPVTASVTDRLTADDRNADGTPNTEALRADLVFNTDGTVSAFQFKVDTLNVVLGSILTLSAKDFFLNTGATGSQRVVQFGSVGASLKLGSLEIGGEARHFGFTADGNFVTGDPIQVANKFAVILNVDSTDGSSFGWPTWLPIRVTSLGVEFTDIVNNPADFTLILSATVTGLPAVPNLKFSGAIEGIKIRPSLLLAGQFPIIDIASIGVSVSGDMFGGELNAALVGGIIKIQKTGENSFAPVDPTLTVPDSQVFDRVLFIGIQGGFSMAGIGGLTIRFALSELGPLGVFLNAEVPGGILLEPNTGLSINDFSAGVEFFKTLPSIDDPLLLRGPQFQVQPTVDAGLWLQDIRGQVFKQWLALRANPNLNGFTAAFTSPMVIKGSAKIFSIYTSQEVFNGQVDLIISTDGKFLITGKLNFASDLISVSGKLYADLSRVSSGAVTVLFLADVPDQVRLLTIDGKLKMGFRDATGQDVAIPVVNLDPVNTSTVGRGTLASPGNGNAVDVGVLNGALHEGGHYVDVLFTPGANRRLDYGSILDGGDSEISLTRTLPNGTVQTLDVNPVPIPIEVTVQDGVLTETAVTAATPEALITALGDRGVQRFRYLLTEPGFAWAPADVTVEFVANAWEQSDGSG